MFNQAFFFFCSFLDGLAFRRGSVPINVSCCLFMTEFLEDNPDREDFEGAFLLGALMCLLVTLPGPRTMAIPSSTAAMLVNTQEVLLLAGMR